MNYCLVRRYSPLFDEKFHISRVIRSLCSEEIDLQIKMDRAAAFGRLVVYTLFDM